MKAVENHGDRSGDRDEDPGGAHRVAFRFDDAPVTRLRFDFAVTLILLDDFNVRIEVPFRSRNGAAELTIEPHVPAAAAPLLDLHQAQLQPVDVHASGELHHLLLLGPGLHVSPPHHESLSLHIAPGHMFIGEIGGVNIAATLACCYALALIAVIVTVLMAVISRQGTMGHLTRYSRRGPIVLSFLLLLGAADLVLGAIMVRRGRRGFVLMVPLAFIFVAGSIGEVVDIIAGSCVTSNLIGGGILLLAVIPLLLLSRELVPAT